MLDLYKHIGNSLQALEGALRISISNADNFNTPGFKYTFTSFTTVFNEVVSSGTTKLNPVQYGGSMTTGSTSTDFSQGNIGFGTPMDLAIVGEGFFVMSQSSREFDAGAPKVFTRSGRFKTDFSGKFITDSFDRKLFGFKLNPDGSVQSNALVPIQTDGETDVGFIEGGILSANFQKNKDDIAKSVTAPTALKPLYRLAISSFVNKQGLILTEGSALKATSASGEPLPFGISSEGKYGSIRAEALESSNISVAKVALDMAQLNRGFSAIQGVIDDVNKVTSQLMQKLIA